MTEIKKSRISQNLEEIEKYLVETIQELSYLVNGLENHGPFLKLVERWQKTNESLDASWHLFGDPVKFNEARVTKFAAMELIDCVAHLKAELGRAELEMAKLRNPTDIVNKDYDPE